VVRFNAEGLDGLRDQPKPGRRPSSTLCWCSTKPAGTARRRLLCPTRSRWRELPPYSPERNPVEPVWLYRRERFLSHRVLNGYTEIVTACCQACNTVTPECLRLLCNPPGVHKVSS